MDLFHPRVPRDSMHPYYRVLTSGLKEAEKALVSEWAAGFPDRDGKFAIEFQTTFNSSLWELYLQATLVDLGLTVDLTRPRPDFCCQDTRGEFVIEATTANHADGYRAPWQGRSQVPKTPEDWAAAIEYSSIRLSNALAAKIRKYRKDYRHLEHVKERPFAVAVAPFESQYTYALGTRAIQRVLYAYDMPVYEDTEEAHQEKVSRVIRGHAELPTTWKPNDAPIPFGLFRDKQASDISAVIFSCVATFGKLSALAKPRREKNAFFCERVNHSTLNSSAGWVDGTRYEETLADGLVVCLNPYATHRFPAEVFDGREVQIVWGYDAENGILRADIPDGFLIARMVCSVDNAEDGDLVLPDPVPSGAIDPKPMPWANSELRFVGGHVGTFDQNHMAHYRGWTVVVCRDQVDDDWTALCCRGSYRDLVSFTAANNTECESHLLGNWHPSKEAAAEAMRRMIDSLCESRTAEP